MPSTLQCSRYDQWRIQAGAKGAMVSPRPWPKEGNREKRKERRGEKKEKEERKKK